MNYWLVVGTPENWKEAFEKGNIWGFRKKQRHRWEALQEGDMVLFYVMRPVAGIVGYGAVKTKFQQTQPLWSEEIEKDEVIWPLRFEFNVEYCLPPDNWETHKVTSELLRFKAGLSFRQLDVLQAKEIITKFKERYVEELEEPISHKEIKQKLIEIGRLQNYIAEGEYPFDLGRLDAVWRRIEQSVPTYVFEVNVKGDLYHDLSKLKHAYDLWNSRIFIVASQADYDKVKALISGSFHEIKNKLKFIDSEKIKELYERKRSFLDLEKELGI
jgi:predicted RNA-binding protein